MIKAQWARYRLDFRFLAKTSREEMTVKDTYFVKIYDSRQPECFGIGECALFKGLSADDTPDFESMLQHTCQNPLGALPPMSAIRFGFETARADFARGCNRNIYDSEWQKGKSTITINGLIWMADKQSMLDQISQKISAGFKALKLKIGGINFEDELSIIQSIRQQFVPDDLTIRLDANGSFTPANALNRLDRLSRFGIHSIEQPIVAGQIQEMAELCRKSPIDIALDEELIGFRCDESRRKLLEVIRPQYIIIKPSLCGGFEAADNWIAEATELGIDWWATSALESDIGLNAIAQWLSTKDNSLPQGLGTGRLYYNNIASPLVLEADSLRYNPDGRWTIPMMTWQG